MTPAAPNTVLDLNSAAPPAPLMGTIVQEVAVTIDKVPIQRGPFVGLAVHLHNGTNSPLMFDGDRARVTVGGQVVTAISDAVLEAATGAPPTARQEARIGIANAITVGMASTIQDAKREKGPILPRYGVDQMRREATLERFGTRILFPGDDTQGIVFFKGNCKLDAAQLELPVVTFPDMLVRGYLTGSR
jgi:hypothetical protein